MEAYSIYDKSKAIMAANIVFVVAILLLLHLANVATKEWISASIRVLEG